MFILDTEDSNKYVLKLWENSILFLFIKFFKYEETKFSSEFTFSDYKHDFLAILKLWPNTQVIAK